MNRIVFTLFLLLFSSWALPLNADLIIIKGGVKGDNNGPLKFDTDNNGTEDITFTEEGKVGLGVTSPTHTLDIMGSFGMIPQTVTTDTTLSGNTSILADTSGGSLTLTLPFAATVPGRMYSIKKVSDSNSLIVESVDLLEKSEAITLTTSSSGFAYLNLISNGGVWNVRSQSTENSFGGSGNLVAWWKFNESTGTSASDSSPSDFTGTLNGATFLSNSVAGNLSTALSFDGSNDFVDFGSPAALDIVSDQMTLSAWVKTSNFGGVILGKSHTNTHSSPYYQYVLYVITPGLIHMRAGSQTVSGTSSIIDNSWHHVVGVYDGSNIKVYVDGSHEASTAKTGGLTSSSRNFRVGARHTDAMGEYMNGSIDDVRIYDRALSDAEVLSIYNLSH